MLNIGDVVEPNEAARSEGKVLRCGSGRYACAVVVSLKPFAIASIDASMLWSCTWEAEELEAVGTMELTKQHVRRATELQKGNQC